ncbi:MAG: hypothetical protein IJE07_04295 [Clostridia bacterium]|nr:hypothetical protein [Clostridia bacterium]
MKKIIIPPFPAGLTCANDRQAHRAQGDEPHAAAKEGVRLSSDWRLYADGVEVPVYAAPVTRGGPHSFARLCWEGDEPVVFVAVRDGGLQKAELLPASYGLTHEVADGAVRFSVCRNGHVTILADGDILQPLTISIDSVREEKKPEEVKGRYFGPGLHKLDTFDFEDGDTLYLAAGAIVTMQPHPAEEQPVNLKDWAGKQNFRTGILAEGKKHVSIEGFGLIDFSLLDWHERKPIVFRSCQDVKVQGVTIVNVPEWNLTFVGCEDVLVDQIRIIGYRENSDGIDVVSTQRAVVQDCFIRTGDDAVVVKAMVRGICGGKDILCQRCVVWNDKVRCFGVAAESVEDIADLTFRDCDVIRSYADWTLELGSLLVYICDHALVQNVLFEDIRIEHEVHLATHVHITKDFWAKTRDAGNIRNVTFRNIAVKPDIPSRVGGYDAEHCVRGVRFENLTVAGKRAETLEEGRIAVCDYAYDVTID